MSRNFLIKIAITLLLFIAIFRKIDIYELFNILISLNIYYLLLSIALVPFLYLIRTFRWSVLLRSISINRSFMDLFKILLIGVFYGLITPGKVGELARAYYLNEKKSVTFSTIVIEKLIDILVLSLLSIITVISFFRGHSVLNYVILLSALSAIIGAWVLANRRIVTILSKLFKLKEDDVEMHMDSISKLYTDRTAMSKTTLLAFLYYLINYVIAIVLLMSLNADIYVVVALPLIILLGNIPITISGLGMRESISAVCFVLLGESGAQGLVFSLILFLTTTMFPGIFGYLLILGNKTMIKISDN